MNLLEFHAMAQARGDGLQPELAALFEHLAIRKDAATILDERRQVRFVQSGAPPSGTPGIFMPGNVVAFHWTAVETENPATPQRAANQER